MTRCYSNRVYRAFSLVEVLVAVAISSILLLIIASLASQSMKVSRHTNNSLVAINTAAEALDLIVTDLESLSVTNQPFEYFQSKTDVPLTGPNNVPVLPNPVQLMLVSTSLADTNSTPPSPGLTRGVWYRVVYQDPINNLKNTDPLFGLYRQVETVNNTFQNILGQIDLSQVDFFKRGPSTTTANDFVAANIIDFQVAFYADGAAQGNTGTNVDGSPVAVDKNPINYDPRASSYQSVRLAGQPIYLNQTTSQQVTNPSFTFTNGYTGPKITWVEVSLMVLEDPGFAILSKNPTIKLTDLKAKYGHTLTRRLPLRMP